MSAASCLAASGWFVGLVLLGAGGIGLAADTAAPPAEDVVLFLTPPPGTARLDTRALVEAVTIYTRDLRLRVDSVSLGSPGPEPARATEIGALVRVRRARLAFWCVPDADGGSLAVFSVDARGMLRTDEVPGLDDQGPDRFRAVALKLRAGLVSVGAGAGANGGAAESSTGRSVVGGVPGAPPAATPGPSEPASSARLRAAVGPGRVEGLPPSSRLAVTAEARVSRAWDQRFTRQALALEGVARPRAWGELALAGEAALPVEQTVPAGTVSVMDFPVRLGARLLGQGSRLTWGIGPFAAVHMFRVSATATDGRRDRRWDAAAGLGIEALARGPLLGRWSWQLGASVEGLAPRTRFLVGSTRALETGRVAAGLVLGVTISTH